MEASGETSRMAATQRFATAEQRRRPLQVVRPRRERRCRCGQWALAGGSWRNRQNLMTDREMRAAVAESSARRQRQRRDRAFRAGTARSFHRRRGATPPRVRGLPGRRPRPAAPHRTLNEALAAARGQRAHRPSPPAGKSARTRTGSCWHLWVAASTWGCTAAAVPAEDTELRAGIAGAPGGCRGPGALSRGGHALAAARDSSGASRAAGAGHPVGRARGRAGRCARSTLSTAHLATCAGSSSRAGGARARSGRAPARGSRGLLAGVRSCASRAGVAVSRRAAAVRLRAPDRRARAGRLVGGRDGAGRARGAVPRQSAPGAGLGRGARDRARDRARDPAAAAREPAAEARGAAARGPVRAALPAAPVHPARRRFREGARRVGRRGWRGIPGTRKLTEEGALVEVGG
jgi:hypothetical protein